MTKRALSFLLAFSLLLAIFANAAAGAEERSAEIYDVEGLKAVAGNPGGAYRLMNDLDMSGVEWVPVAFSGTFDGGGHTIYNLTVTQPGPDRRSAFDGNKKEYDTAFAGLFSVLENASVQNVKLVGVHVDIQNDSHCFAAGLAGYADRSTIKNCTVKGRINMVSSGVMVGVAGLIGYGCGKIERCNADVELVFEDRNRDSRCEEFMGGILACGIADIRACMVDIDGYDSCHGYVHNGGVVGMYYHCRTKYDAGVVNDNIVSGQIHFFEDNPDRRAYCKAVIGEDLSKPTQTKGNTDSFQSHETKNFDVVLKPEACEEPVYVETVIEPSGTQWGYVRHSCTGCGYAWTDSYYR